MNSPITEQDIKSCEKAVYECACAEQELARMRALGLDTTEMDARCEQLKQFHQLVIDHYKPLLPTNSKSKR